MIELPFAAQEADGGFSQHSRESLLNMYVEKAEGKSKIVRRQRPGLTLVESISGAKRGIAEFVHGHYFVVRQTVYRYDGEWVEPLGSINSRVGPVTIISDDLDNIAISDGSELWHYTEGALALIETPSAVGTLAFQAGRGVYNEPGTDRWYISGLNDFSSWSSLDFASAESQDDPLVRVFEDRGELWMFGGRTTEIWRNAGAQTFPYVLNAAIQRGCLAPFSVASDDNTIFWLGDDGIVYRADGYRPARMSTHAIEDWIGKAPHPDRAQAFIYTTRGHKFYTLTFPGYGTRQFNIATQLWNRAATFGQPDWRIVGGAGRPVSVYLNDDGIVRLDDSVNKDVNLPIERGGISAPVYNGGERMTFHEFWMNLEVGRVAEGADEPQIMLAVSRDGENFGTSRPRGMGLTGDYNRLVMWRGLGMSRQFTLKYTVTDDVAVKITSTGGEIR